MKVRVSVFAPSLTLIWWTPALAAGIVRAKVAAPALVVCTADGTVGTGAPSNVTDIAV